MVSSIKLSKPINGKPVFDGEYKPSNLDKIFDDIVLRKDELILILCSLVLELMLKNF